MFLEAAAAVGTETSNCGWICTHRSKGRDAALQVEGGEQQPCAGRRGRAGGRKGGRWPAIRRE